jgi:predicted nicotinamide N-methyase
MSDAPLEKDLRARFDVRAETFSHGGFRVEMIMPRAADELLDEQAFEIDERLPYWAELWPSARALARHVIDHPPSGRVIELGCGVGLPSLALRFAGVNITASDYYDDALLFARANAHRNHLAPLATALVDWRSPPAELGRFDTIVIADVLYEQRNIALVESVLRAMLAPGGQVILADPRRAHLPAFITHMKTAGWRVDELAQITEPQPGARSPSRIVLLNLRR